VHILPFPSRHELYSTTLLFLRSSRPFSIYLSLHFLLNLSLLALSLLSCPILPLPSSPIFSLSAVSSLSSSHSCCFYHLLSFYSRNHTHFSFHPLPLTAYFFFQCPLVSSILFIPLSIPLLLSHTPFPLSFCFSLLFLQISFCPILSLSPPFFYPYPSLSFPFPIFYLSLPISSLSACQTFSLTPSPCFPISLPCLLF
jgi:hypothetical protein